MHMYGIHKSLILHKDWSHQLIKKDAAAMEMCHKCWKEWSVTWNIFGIAKTN